MTLLAKLQVHYTTPLPEKLSLIAPSLLTSTLLIRTFERAMAAMARNISKKSQKCRSKLAATLPGDVIMTSHSLAAGRTKTLIPVRAQTVPHKKYIKHAKEESTSGIAHPPNIWQPSVQHTPDVVISNHIIITYKFISKHILHKFAFEHISLLLKK